MSRQLQPGDRVALSGTVSYERSGFVSVVWDDGTKSMVRRIDLLVAHDAPPRKDRD